MCHKSRLRCSPEQRHDQNITRELQNKVRSYNVLYAIIAEVIVILDLLELRSFSKPLAVAISCLLRGYFLVSRTVAHSHTK